MFHPPHFACSKQTVLMLVLIALRTRHTAQDICKHEALARYTHDDTKTCQNFLLDSSLPTTTGLARVMTDCLVLKRSLASQTTQRDNNQKYTCACPPGYKTAEAVFHSTNNGVYIDVSAFVVQTKIWCDTFCGTSYQQAMQADTTDKCSCQNSYGCVFHDRDIPDLITRTRNRNEIEQSLLLIPDNLQLPADIVHCKQEHCSPPTPVQPRLEMLCVSHGIPFARCDTCQNHDCTHTGAICEAHTSFPYCTMLCMQGYYKNTSTAKCTLCPMCPVDSFEIQPCSHTGPTQCMPCAFGRFLPPEQIDKRVCSTCPHGQYSVHGTGVCVSNNKLSNHEVTRKLLQCPNGTSWNNVTQFCSPCPPSHTTSADGACKICPEHKHNNGQEECVACPDELVRNSDEPDCHSCPPGTFKKPNTSTYASCVPCDPNHINPGDLGECVLCNNLSFANSDSTVCKSCPPSQHRVTKQGLMNQTCDFCPMMHELNEQGGCDSCNRSLAGDTCEYDEANHLCDGEQHPRLSGKTCACGCHTCVLSGLPTPSPVYIDQRRCRLQCPAEYRLLLDTIDYMQSQCTKDHIHMQTSYLGKYVFNPTDSQDLTYINCVDTVLNGGIDAARAYKMTGYPPPTETISTTMPCSQNSGNPPPGNSNTANCTTKRIKSLQLSLLTLSSKIKNKYKATAVSSQCFFRCMTGYEFQEDRWSAGLYMCALSNSTCKHTNTSMPIVQYPSTT